MTDGMIIACPKCDARNRVPHDRSAAEGKCGQCGSLLFLGKPLTLIESRFQAHAVKSDLPLLVDFWAPWCGPCHTMTPTFEAATREFEPRLRFGKVDTDAEPELAGRYGIRSIPTLILFRRGKEIARVNGALPPGELRRWIGQSL
jgi:thioredoxin 2